MVKVSRDLPQEEISKRLSVCRHFFSTVAAAAGQRVSFVSLADGLTYIDSRFRLPTGHAAAMYRLAQLQTERRMDGRVEVWFPQS